MTTHKHQAQGLPFAKNVAYLRVVLLLIFVALTFNGYSVAADSHHHDFRSEVRLGIPSSDLPSGRTEDHCLSCHIGCGCHDALPAIHIVELTMPRFARVAFAGEDAFLPSAYLKRPARPPRPRVG